MNIFYFIFQPIKRKIVKLIVKFLILIIFQVKTFLVLHRCFERILCRQIWCFKC